MKVILASASPRRCEILKNIYDDFDVMPADIEETYSDDMDLQLIPAYLADKKARHIFEKNRGALVIGADTGVFIDGMMLGKPSNKKEAFNMLKSLSGRSHTVITGCAVYYMDKSITFSEATCVTFDEMTDKEILDYIATGDPMDKAGSYGVQGRGALFVKRIDGDYYNVMGLPLCRLNRELKKL